MNLRLLQRLEKHVHKEGVSEYLLLPVLPSEQVDSCLYELIFLGALYRLSRKHPYTVACVDTQSFIERSQPEDVQYLYSLPSLSLNGQGTLKYIERGDVSPFIPRSEDEFLLLLPNSPPSRIPLWPQIVLDLNTIFVTQVDEFIKIQTSDPEVVGLLESVPTTTG